MYHSNRKYHNTLKRTLGDDKITNQGHTNSDYHQWQNKLDALALVVTFKNLIHLYTVHQILYLCVVWKQNIKTENVQNLFCLVYLICNRMCTSPFCRSVNFLLNIKSLNYLLTVCYSKMDTLVLNSIVIQIFSFRLWDYFRSIEINTTLSI